MTTNFTVMVRFGDNDFHSTFIPVLLALRAWLQYSQEWEHYKDKEKLVRLINRLAPIAYDHVQNTHGRGTSTRSDYLQIDADRVLVGTEVDEYLSTKMDQANSAWFILDMRIPVADQQVFSV